MSLLNANLQAFLAVVKNKTVLAAAAELNLTQTAVTQRLRVLERDLGTSLFIRSRRGMIPTAEGEVLLRYSQSVAALSSETLRKLRGGGLDTETRITVLGPTSLMRTRLIPACAKVMRDYPNLLMRFEIQDTPNGVEALRSGRAQLAVLKPHEVGRELESKLLRAEQYVLVATRKWRNRELKDIVTRERIIDFDESDDATLNYLKKFRLLSSARPERHFVNNTESLLELLSQGLGYGVLTREFAERHTKSFDLVVLNAGHSVENRLALAWFARAEAPEYFRSLLAAIH